MEALAPHYMAIKHSHLLLIGLSVILFIWRFALVQKGSSWLQQKWLKITPHVIDTLLLTTGGLLSAILMQYPLQAPWLTEKLVAVIAYILLAVVAMRHHNKIFQYVAFFGALGWLVYAAKLAHFKQAILLN